MVAASAKFILEIAVTMIELMKKEELISNLNTEKSNVDFPCF